jgi:hypothetical protein
MYNEQKCEATVGSVHTSQLVLSYVTEPQLTHTLKSYIKECMKSRIRSFISARSLTAKCILQNVKHL